MGKVSKVPLTRRTSASVKGQFFSYDQFSQLSQGVAPYTISDITLNGRNIPVSRIAAGEVDSGSSFEETTLRIVRDWVTGEQNFTITTSGSTGVPKKIVFTREQLTASATLSVNALRVRQGSTSLVCIDTRYIGGLMMIVRSLIQNMRMIAIEPDALPLQKIPIDRCVNFAAFAPYQVHSMLGSKHPHLINGIQTVIIGGAPIHPRDVAQLQQLQCLCYETYGMTETISHVALRPLNRENAVDYFQTLPGVKISADARDCLVIDAPYLKGSVVTNDRVELISNREFRWLGRWDNVINTGGIKVSPEKIEATIGEQFSKLGLTPAFFIHGMPEPKLGTCVALIIEANDDAIVSAVQSALDHLGDVLTRYERPREIHVSPSFVRTPTGKIQRRHSLEKITRVLPAQE